MQETQQTKKKLRTLIIIMVVIIIPGIVRTINSSAFASVRWVDIIMLFVTGVATGVLIVTVKIISV
jgi:hypothetical protein